MEILSKPSYKTSRIKNIVLCGLLIAIVIVFTIAVRVPTVITGGYINLGDIIVIFSGYLLGGKKGALIGGTGSALADLLGGYPLFAPITLIAKGGEGFFAGFFGKTLNKNKKFSLLLVGGILSGFWMVLSYFLGEWLYMGLAKSMTALVPNIIQALAGIILALILYQVTGRKLN